MDVNYSLNRVSTVDSAFTMPSVSLPDTVASRQDYEFCRQIMQSASKNYSAAGRHLPSDKRPYVEALYALMRVGDDRVDVAHEGFASPLDAIEDWENAYWAAFVNGDSPHPVLRAYLDTANKFSIPPETMSAYFRAMKDDLTVTRFPTFADLLHYMDGSAIPVGRAMTYILGVRSGYSLEQALDRADSLSIAMQLSNFWRDIGEDWQRGRIYLPLADMDFYQVTEADLATGRITSQFGELLEFEFDRTERYYQHARKGIPMLASGNWAVNSALEIYRAIIAGIRSNRYDVFSQRASAGSLKKASLILQSYRITRNL